VIIPSEPELTKEAIDVATDRASAIRDALNNAKSCLSGKMSTEMSAATSEAGRKDVEFRHLSERMDLQTKLIENAEDLRKLAALVPQATVATATTVEQSAIDRNVVSEDTGPSRAGALGGASVPVGTSDQDAEDERTCISFGLKKLSSGYAACRLKLLEIRAINTSTAQTTANAKADRQLEEDRLRNQREAEEERVRREQEAMQQAEAERQRIAKAEAARREKLVWMCKSAMLMRPTRTGSTFEGLANANKCDADPNVYLQPEPPSYTCAPGIQGVTCTPH
jgi:hypothetical protein